MAGSPSVVEVLPRALVVVELPFVEKISLAALEVGNPFAVMVFLATAASDVLEFGNPFAEQKEINLGFHVIQITVEQVPKKSNA